MRLTGPGSGNGQGPTGPFKATEVKDAPATGTGKLGSKLLNDLFDGAKKAGGKIAEPGGRSITDRLIKGLTRTLSKTFLRPRGYLELASGLLTGGLSTLFFLGKHFTEGFLGINSLFLSRKMKFTPKFWDSNNEYNTLASMLKGNKNAAYVEKHAAK